MPSDVTLRPGTRFGQYAVGERIGAGGMGEVYRATDTTLERDVAIKVLPAALADDAERIARFEREARTLAALNHPNVAHIYGLETAGGVHALVMELVEGPTLADRIAAGPIPVDEALGIAAQIADGLEAAHAQGIVHRDLKPANVKLRPDGTVKVLDFGIAKALEPQAMTSGTPSPVLTTPATLAGVILGTAAYMAPEQARGRAVDARADVWSFGCVLYEMLTGQPAFGGEDVTITLARVLERDTDVDSLPAAVPPAVRRTLRLCLRKDLRERIADIRDVRLALAGAFVVEAPRAQAARAGAIVPWTLAAALAAVAIVAVWAPWRTEPAPDRPPLRFSTDLEGTVLPDSSVAISRDGTRIAYRTTGADGAQRLATRLLSETTGTPLIGTEDGYNPFFSPNGEWLAYLARNRLMKVPVEGGVPIVLAEAPAGRSGSWSEDGHIYAELNPFLGIQRLSDQGGTPESLTRPTQRRHSWPQALNGGELVLYTAGLAGLLDNGRIEILTVATGETTTVLDGGYMARYVASGPSSGHILYLNLGVLYAVPFDLERLRTLGEPVQLADDVASSGVSRVNAFDVSATGTLIYLQGRLPQAWPIYWADRAGNVEPLLETPGAYYTPRVSPDGTRVVYSAGDERGQDIYVYDTTRDVGTRLTFTSAGNLWPVWAPDGEHVAFTSLAEERAGLWWVSADGTGAPRLLLERENPVRQIALSPDGRALAFTEQRAATSSDIWILPLDPSDPNAPVPGEPRPLIETRFAEGAPAFSPDGRWIAYLSDELGQYDLFVQPFPGLGGRWQISSGGGSYPYWSRTEPALLFSMQTAIDVNTPGMASVAYTVQGERFIPGRVSHWPIPPIALAPVGFESRDLAPDGRFAYLPDLSDGSDASRIAFFMNVFDELNRRAPAGE